MVGRPKGDGIHTKRLIVEKATELFLKKGYSAVGIKEILTAVAVTKGSLYFHFPGGKEDLALEVMSLAAEDFWKKLLPDEAFDWELPRLKEHLGQTLSSSLIVDSDREDTLLGCPVAMLGLEAPTLKLKEKSQLIYRSWQEDLERLTTKLGKDKSLAVTLLMLIEGGIVLAKIHDDPAYLTAAIEKSSGLLLASS